MWAWLICVKLNLDDKTYQDKAAFKQENQITSLILQTQIQLNLKFLKLFLLGRAMPRQQCIGQRKLSSEPKTF
jgi:hypothetical protein